MSKSKHATVLRAIFAQPAHAGIRWSDIEALLASLGAEIEEGAGWRVRVALNGERAVFHRPHPQPTTDKGSVKSIRRFLIGAGVQPE